MGARNGRCGALDSVVLAASARCCAAPRTLTTPLSSAASTRSVTSEPTQKGTKCTYCWMSATTENTCAGENRASVTRSRWLNGFEPDATAVVACCVAAEAWRSAAMGRVDWAARRRSMG